MRKMMSMLIILSVMFCICGCKGTYQDGYDEGFADGYSEAKSDISSQLEEEFLIGYDIGYDDGYDDGSESWEDDPYDAASFFEEEASFYANENGGYSPEFAWEIILAYRNNEPYYSNGAPPSRQDYLDAVDSLYYFYEYFSEHLYK